MRRIVAEPLTAEAFAPFGQVIEAHGQAERVTINEGTTERFHDLVPVECRDGGAPTINIFRSQPRALPVTLELMERHPLGSQAFVPLSDREFLVVVAEDEGGRPGTPRAFLTAPGQGVNYPANAWHSPLIALGDVSDFLVVDRGRVEGNLEEFRYENPFEIAVER